MKPTYEQLEQRLIESERYGRQTDITIDNLEMKLAQIAAENAGLKESRQRLAEFIHEELDADYPLNMDIETPATDAFLAEVRASAIDNLLSIKTKQLADMHPDTHAFGANAMSIRSQINELQVFAAQLRKGVQS
ncbi:hypothetical protein [Enterobacter cloacae complex sp. FDA-CDC-AR_0164]|uniref:hypothetical protein n=1 Tax=Enterobacter cloacae complex sp. FDA-CDC-AR_0164 TaxID=2077136 RepID=UPI0015E18936|nr:hypothetical protein [Enterobacter cloacae complex sp. FDA-CDC-AR_0164]